MSYDRRAVAGSKDPLAELTTCWNQTLEPAEGLEALIKKLKKTRPELIGHLREAIDALQKARGAMSMARMGLNKSV